MKIDKSRHDRAIEDENRANISADDLLEDFKDKPNGLALGDLLRLHPIVPRRTVQRWISQLIANKKIKSEGQGRARRYYIPTQQDFFDIPLSADSRVILQYIDQPTSKRKPVGYQIPFIQDYKPNETYYLTNSLRNQLRKMGDLGQEMLIGVTYERTVLGRLLIDLSWASSHLEGNTYSLLDTKELIEHGKVAKGKDAIETQMILNHKSAIELLFNNKDTIKFNRYTMLNLHSALSENLLSNPSDEGRLRQRIVEINKSVFHPLSIPQKIEEVFDILLAKVSMIQDPFEQSFFLMIHIPYLQPFIDVNKRTSRLAANIPLIRHRLCPLSFVGVTEQAYTRAILGVYELTRVELLRDLFVWAYERSTQEYVAIKQEVTEPDPLRLQYRTLIKQIVRDVILNPKAEPLTIILKNIAKVDADVRENLQALIIEELRRIHEGTLARYSVSLSDFHNWKKKHI